MFTRNASIALPSAFVCLFLSFCNHSDAAVLKWSYSVPTLASGASAYQLDDGGGLPAVMTTSGTSAWLFQFDSGRPGAHTNTIRLIWLGANGAVILTNDIIVHPVEGDVRFLRFTASELALGIRAHSPITESTTNVICRFKRVNGRIVQSEIPLIGEQEYPVSPRQTSLENLGFFTFDSLTSTIRRYSN